jgi:hypothetical protein
MLIIVDGYGTIQLYIRIVYDKIAIVKSSVVMDAHLGQHETGVSWCQKQTITDDLLDLDWENRSNVYSLEPVDRHVNMRHLQPLCQMCVELVFPVKIWLENHWFFHFFQAESRYFLPWSQQRRIWGFFLAFPAGK